MYSCELSFFKSVVFYGLLVHSVFILLNITKYVFYINRDSDHQYHHWPFRWGFKEAIVSLSWVIIAISIVGYRFTDLQFRFLQILFTIYYVIGFLYVLQIKK